jgi:uncharacterized protein YndB with AHSA1/START domain
MGEARSADADDLIDDREYAAPRELVFECWTRAEHFARWFAPNAFEVPACEIDARPGGAIRFVHRGPKGDVVILGVFDEVVAPEHLQFTFTFVDAADRPVAPVAFPEWPVGVHIVMAVELHATARGTRMRVRQHVLEREAADSPIVRRHRELSGIGWGETAERLVRYLDDRGRS